MTKLMIIELVKAALIIGLFVIGCNALIIHGGDIAASLEHSARLFDLR